MHPPSESDVFYCVPGWVYSVPVYGMLAEIAYDYTGEDFDLCVRTNPAPNPPPVVLSHWFDSRDKSRSWSAPGATVAEANSYAQAIANVDVTYSGDNPQGVPVTLTVSEQAPCDIPDGGVDTDTHTLRLWRGPHFGQSGVVLGSIWVVCFVDEILPSDPNPDPEAETWIGLQRLGERFAGRLGAIHFPPPYNADGPGIWELTDPGYGTPPTTISDWIGQPRCSYYAELWNGVVAVSPAGPEPIPGFALAALDNTVDDITHRDGIIEGVAIQIFDWEFSAHRLASPPPNLFDPAHPDLYPGVGYVEIDQWPVRQEFNYSQVLDTWVLLNGHWEPVWVEDDGAVFFTATRRGIPRTVGDIYVREGDDVVWWPDPGPNYRNPRCGP